MSMQSRGWADFWKAEKRSFHEMMRLATGTFASRFDERFQLSSTQEILDYGCGPGFLADCFLEKKIRITGVDINDAFIKEGRSNHSQSVFIHITTDQTENRKILDAALKDKKFDFIVLLSITQYLKNVEELEGIMVLLLSYLHARGKIILADIIDENTSSLRDAAALLQYCIRKGKVVSFFRFMYYLMFSTYAQVSKRTRLLKVSEEAIQALARQHLLQVEKVMGLTLHPSRVSYVLTRNQSEQRKYQAD